MKIKLKNKINQSKGITLIALVVTIIVLLILAGVSIAMLTGEGGILKNAREAREMTDIADIKEQVQMDILEEQMKNNSGDISKGKLIEILKRYFEEEGIPQEDDEKWEDLASIDSLHTLPQYGNYDIDITDVYNQNFPAEPKPGDIVDVPVGKSWDKDKVDPTLDEERNVIPVPKGFYFLGGTENTGVVISDKENDTMENTSGETQGNQFVWVPVPNVIWTGTDANEIESETYKPMATKYLYNDNTYYRGMLYTFSGTTATYQEEYNVGTTSYREPSLVTGYSDKWAPMEQDDIKGTYHDAAEANYSTVVGLSSPTAFGKQMQEDFDNMIKSVDKYKGFYVARYEMSLNEGKAEYKKGKKSATNGSMTNHWYDYYKIQKEFAKDTKKQDSVASSMIWGSQYDAMMNWMAINNIPVGDNTIDNHERNTNRWAIAESTDILNNVYDLLGNSVEWTLEAYSSNSRIGRGGVYEHSYSPGSYYTGSPTHYNDYFCSRATLYMQV